MHFSSKLLGVVCGLLCIPMYGWHTIYRLEELIDFIDSSQRTLVVCDIDNTLLRPKTVLGSDQWFSYMVRDHITRGLDSKAAIQEVMPLYSHVAMHIDLVAIEPTVCADIAAIKNNCERAICLTARSHHLADKTMEQLHNNGLRFFEPSFEDYFFECEHPCIYKQGVIFCGLNNKGDMLLQFLNTFNCMPELIIFVDDKEHNLSCVGKALENSSINFIGLRYAGCDDHVANFDMCAAGQELELFLMQHPICD